ncbi:hypothetical protein GCM10027034_36670 [Ramlibacter solisilvae]|uniref:Uncharacterized protein n=1 Tax=Ramlibacter tataouinensis TaxID=94132 RepID=A0A127JUL4_9BURK|nr:hypothetical protein [Ramlibacter tataouinensis]AMO23718.1 hypothetical protein UC35_13640 [Ramlibacter tataouinensis]
MKLARKVSIVMALGLAFGSALAAEPSSAEVQQQVSQMLKKLHESQQQTVRNLAAAAPTPPTVPPRPIPPTFPSCTTKACLRR